MSRFVFFGIALVLLMSLPASAAAPGAWEQDANGKWRQVDRPATATSAPTDEPTLNRIEQLIDARRYRQAEDRAIAWLLAPANRNSSARDRALFLVARALYGFGNRIKSFYYLDELVDTYPESPLFFPALNMQYGIADAFLEGYRRRFARMPLFRADEEAIEMLYRVRNRAPGSPLAERALLRTADHYRFDGQFDFAADAYAFYARQYPRSPMTPRARLWGAYCSLAQFRGVQFDATLVIDAREQLRSIAAAYPDLAKEEDIDSILARIDGAFAKKLYTTATFYRRTNEPGAAAYTYRYLMMAYPTAEETARAKMWLAELPPWAQKLPGPTVVGDEAPGSAEAPLIR